MTEILILFPIKKAEHATVLASLRTYQAQGYGDPENRPDDISSIATCDGSVAALDDGAIDNLCERINLDSQTSAPRMIAAWTAISDDDNGHRVTVHGSELAAWQAIKNRFCKYAHEKPLFDKHIAAGTFAELKDWLQTQLSKGGIDSYSVEKHFLQIDDANSPVSDKPNDAGVSDDPNAYGVSITVDVRSSDGPEGAKAEFIKDTGISNTEALTYHVSNLKTGEQWELE
jgi:hypothetical protein